MKTALVTGADGFIGSHLTELLIEKGYKVKALSYYNSFNYWGWLEDISPNPNLEVIAGDIRDPHQVKIIMKGVDIVFHLAALIGIPYSYYAPDSYLETNIKGTFNVCQAAKDLGNIRLINTSSSEVYGTAQYVPIDEMHPKQPQSPYSASKIGADAMAMSFYYAYDLPLTTIRPFNTYGPRQSARAIIPNIITQIACGKKEVMLGDIKPTRDFNYVKDTVMAFLAIAESEETIGKEINVASNFEVSIETVFLIIQEIMKSNVQIRIEEKRLRPPNSEVIRLWGNNSLIKRLTKWEPAFSLKEGLEATIDWFLNPENLNKYKVDKYNL